MRRILATWMMAPALALAFATATPSAYAQHHHGGHVHASFSVGVGWPYYWGFYYGPYSPFWYPYYSFYPSPVFYPPYGWYGLQSDVTSAIRIEVNPRDAKVYVDGYYAGVVDDFDGTFQRLRLPPGKHEVRLFQTGYHSITQTMYLSPGNTYKIKGELTRLAPGEPEETPPVPPPPSPDQAQIAQNAPPPLPFGETTPPAGPAPQGGVSAMPPTPMPPSEPAGNAAASRFGQLAIRVQPSSAEVYIDGERWLTPDTTDRMIVNVAEGRHHIEIHKSGYDSFSTEIDVRPGETTPLNVSLPPRNR